jgi:apolipoprotein N-acyltransferase
MSSAAVAWLQRCCQGQLLLTGAFRVDLGPTGERAYNTLLALRRIETVSGPDLELLAVYDKHRLVPLGEYLPLRPVLEPIGFVRLVQAPADFTPGPRPAPISAPGLPRVQPLICYESLFPGLAAQSGDRPLWIVNISNDSWFGRTSGPWQHLNIASHRASSKVCP